MKITTKQNIKISVIISLITMVISVLVHIIYTPFMLSKIGDAQYGLYTFVTSTLSWLTVAVNAILAAYNKIASEQIIKDPQNGENKTNGVYGLIVAIWACIISLLCIIFILLFHFNIIELSAYSESDQQTIQILFIFVAVQMVITVLTKVTNLNITFNNHHIWIKIGTLLVTILPPVISIPFLLNGCGVITVCLIIVLTNIASNLADVIFDRFVLKKKIFVKPNKEITQLIKPVFIFCSVILVNEIAYQIDCSVDNMVLGFLGCSEQITLYSLAAYLVATAQTCISLIYTPLIPTIFQNESKGLREKNKELFDLITFGQLFIWLMITGGFAACGYYFTKMWVGEDRLIVFYIAVSLFLIRSFSACSGPSKDMMRASNKHKQRAVLAVFGALINLGVTLTLATLFQEDKVLWACVIGTAISSVICWWIIANILNVKYLKLNIRKYIARYVSLLALSALSALVSLIIVYFCKITSDIINLLIGGPLFCVFFLLSTYWAYKKEIKKVYSLIRAK